MLSNYQSQYVHYSSIKEMLLLKYITDTNQVNYKLFPLY